jgi:ABC-type Na+ transport system ATPase subunit NatA
MTQKKKHGDKPHTPLKEDIFNHIDYVYRSARRSKNFSVALKALELYLKAKSAKEKNINALMHLHDLSNTEIEQIVNQLSEDEPKENLD